MKKVAIVLIIAIVGGFSLFAFRGSRDQEVVNYRLVAVEQGDLEALVSSTGTLDAVTTVQVGTQVSGIIDEICADFNDPVEKGQVIARIDTTLLASAVAGAEAQLARSEAELKQAKREYSRNETLHDEDVISDSDFSRYQYNLDVALASVQSAQVDLARARQNLQYATITSPVDGTIISRSVDVGQTVQASFSSPELFLIAGDLARMQILVAVDESDIGLIAEKQTVRFTVQAYPDDTFTGKVRQVRMQSVTQENVVSYTAVVDVVNSDGRLLPGMTATVDFLVETASDVLYVANASLRYKPDDDAAAAAFEKLRSEREAERDGGDAENSPPQRTGEAGNGDRGMLWTVDEEGELAAIPVRTGISDGSYTVVMGRMLELGQQVIAGVSRSEATASSASSPFQQQDQTGGNRPPGPPSPGGF